MLLQIKTIGFFINYNIFCLQLLTTLIYTQEAIGGKNTVPINKNCTHYFLRFNREYIN